MAATKAETSTALAALTSAALFLPGLTAQADVASNDIISNVSYGHYQESSRRMHVDIYHADALVPLTENLELSVSLDRDTYTGATPAYSLPVTLTNQLKTGGVRADIVSAASPIASAAMLTTMGLNGFLAFQNANATEQTAAESQINTLEAPFYTTYQTSLQAEISALNNNINLPLTTVNPVTYAATTVNLNSLLNSGNAATLAAQDQLDINTINNYYTNLIQTLQTQEQQYTNNNPIIQAYLNQQTIDQNLVNQDQNALSNAQAAYANWLPHDSSTVDAAIANTTPGGNGSRAGVGDGNSVTLGFNAAASNYSAFTGYGNETPQANGNCSGTGGSGCYYEDGMVVSALGGDPLGGDHVHHVSASSTGAGATGIGESNDVIMYHSDSDGIYIRAQDGGAFSLNSMAFDALTTGLSGANPVYGASPALDVNGILQPDGTGVLGPNEFWQIIGFNTSVNPNLPSSNPAAQQSLPNEVAYAAVKNGFDGVLNLTQLNPAFADVNSVWIHYDGYPMQPTNGIDFQLAIDNLNVSSANTSVTTSTAQLWQIPNQTYLTEIANANAALLNAQQALQNEANLIASSNASLSAIQSAIGILQNAQNGQNGQVAAWETALTTQYNQQLTANSQATTTLNNSINSLSSQINAITEQAGIAAYTQVLNSLVPTGTPTVQHFQMMPLETRSQPLFNLKYYLDNSTVAVSGGLSDEPDFLSNFGSINLSHQFNDKLTTLTGGYSLSSNSISRNTGMMSMGNMAGMNSPAFGPTQYPTLNAKSEYNTFNLGLSQVIDKNTLFQTSVSYTNQSGYLSNPYKDVYIRGIITPTEYYAMSVNNAATNWSSITNLQVIGVELFRENRPTSRNIWSFSNQLKHNITDLDATLHGDYRFYIDDWGILSHTFTMKWLQSLPGGFTITPDIRYYTQSQADFFAPYFLAPRADGYYTSDYRLSAFGELSGGVTISKKFTKGIRFDTSIEYVSHAGGLKLGGGGVGNYADFDYYMLHANLNVDLSAKLFSGSDASDEHAMHHHHHHHGAPLPAGVMYGHMMNQSDDMMVGYRYMYSSQRGAMLNGSTPVSDQTLTANACHGYTLGCLYKPLTMNMQMHMLDFMYAPTDWLNLMIMPQLMSMDMTMSGSLTGTDDPTMPMGGVKMNSNNLADTITTALIKVLEEDGHHAHVGVGLSAPTGSINQKMGETYTQGYGMQTGTGTWDLKPSLTYTGQADEWGWGAQLSGVKHLGRNKYDFTYGDIFQATGWGSYQIFNWLSATIRGVYTLQDSIHGNTNQANLLSTPVNYPGNYGGRFVDVGLGLNASFHEGQFANHSVSFEWLQPVSTDFNGYQLDRNGALSVSWNYAF